MSRGPQSVQSVPPAHIEYSAPPPPSSQSPSSKESHVLEQPTLLAGGGGGGRGGAVAVRGPQSAQSVPKMHIENSDPAPPSSQSPSSGKMHVLVQPGTAVKGGGGGCFGGDGGKNGRGPQSVQSVS